MHSDSSSASTQAVATELMISVVGTNKGRRAHGHCGGGGQMCERRAVMLLYRVRHAGGGALSIQEDTEVLGACRHPVKSPGGLCEGLGGF